MKIFLAAALLAAVPAAAQVNLDREAQDPSRRSAAETKAAQAADAAAPDEIGFDEVMKKPGDLNLNERYAREQIRRGDLRGAALTLERVLILAPGRDATRLLYAAVLYRLDALVDSERELRQVLGRLASKEVIEEAKAYLKVVESRRRKNHFDARVFFGYGWDDNRNAAADSDKNLFFGTPVKLNPDSRRTDDTHFSFGGSLGYSRDFGGAKPHKFFAGVGYYRGEQTMIDLLDLQAYNAGLGVTLRWRGWDLTPAASFDHILLSQSSYLRNSAQSFRLGRKVAPRVEAYAEFRREDQDFVRTPLVTNAEDREGNQYDYALGAAWAATPRDRLAARFTHRRKMAKNAVFAYRRESAGGEYTRLLGKGRFFQAGITGNFDRYDRPDRTIDSQSREDDQLVLTALYGQPLDLFWKPLKGFTGTLAYERFKSYSNILNYAYTNTRLSALIAYKWGI